MATYSPTGLPKDWAFSPSIDLELKQYALLGYMQRVQARFDERKLYPHLTDVRSQAGELLRLQRSKESLLRSLHTPIIGFDLSTGLPLRARPEDPDHLRVIDDVIDFAVPNLLRLLDQGNGLRDELAQRVHFAPVGVQPLRSSEGWLLIRLGSDTRVYAYSIPLVQEQDPDLSHLNVHTHFVTTYTMSLSRTPETIKTDLILRYRERPNPAAFAVETEAELPCIETLMPLAKRMVHAHVTARA